MRNPSGVPLMFDQSDLILLGK